MSLEFALKLPVLFFIGKSVVTVVVAFGVVCDIGALGLASCLFKVCRC